MNELAHLKRLSAVRTNAGIKFLTPAAFPGNHCPLHTALALSSNIKGMSTLVVGTAECGTYSRNVIYRSKHQNSGLHWMYVLDADEVVFGCRRGLVKAIRSMDEAGAKAIMLIFTCVPEVIGEDAEGIVHELQPEIGARLSYVQIGHFKCNSYPSGFFKTLEAFGRLMEPSAPDPFIINILGRSPEEEHIPMPLLLQELAEKGFTLRMLAPKSDMQDFIAAPGARLNLVLSPYMNPLANLMEKEFGVPYVSLHDIYSVLQIDTCLNDLERELSICWNGAFAEERKEALALEARMMNSFRNISYITTPGNSLMPLPLALYLTEFHMKPLLLHMEEFYPDDRQHAKKLFAKNEDPLLCHMVNDKADAAVIEHLAPDLAFGEIPAGTGAVPSVSHLYELYGQAGYERTVLLLKRMLDTWEKAEKKEEHNGHGNTSV